jgi:hypothetical protein
VPGPTRLAARLHVYAATAGELSNFASPRRSSCQDQSKKRSDAAEGTKGTPFSQCVRAMAKLAKGTSDSPRKACKDLSSRCVVEGAKLR